jgi:hypothetical protein
LFVFRPPPLAVELNGAPDKEMRIGDSWPFTRQVDAPIIGKLSISMTNTLRGWQQHEGAKCARVEFTGTVNSMGGAAGPRGGSIAINDGQVKGAYWYDPAIGLSRELKLDQSYTVTVFLRVSAFNWRVVRLRSAPAAHRPAAERGTLRAFQSHHVFVPAFPLRRDRHRWISRFAGESRFVSRARGGLLLFAASGYRDDAAERHEQKALSECRGRDEGTRGFVSHVSFDFRAGKRVESLAMHLLKQSLIAALLGSFIVVGCSSPRTAPPVAAPAAAKTAPPVVVPILSPGTHALFDGKTLQGWGITDFSGAGKVTASNGQINLGDGYMTGVHWTGAVPKMNYEVSLEAKRVSGSDFFCGLTFPIGEEFASFIVGGWGGGTVGISSVDSEDASQNETSSQMNFTNDKWYRIRVRVTPTHLQAWIDDEQVVKLETKERRFSIRLEVEASKPLGVATWNTAAALRNIKLTTL